MKTRHAIQLGCLLSTILAQLTSIATAAETSTRPNILWILAEDICPDIACYGTKVVKTPNLDRLAAEGALFKHAYSTAPVCSASRSAMMVGMYQHCVGAHQHRTADKQPLPNDVRTYTQHLRAAGYYTCTEYGAKTDLNFTTSKLFDGKGWSNRKPDESAFAKLVQRYERSVIAVARAVLQDHHAAQDIAQEAFITAYKKLGDLRNTAIFGAWLMRIARRKAMKVALKQSNSPQTSAHVDVVPVRHNGQPDNRNDELLQAIVRLRESERQAVLLRYFEKLSVSEISQATGRPVGTVTKQLSRAHHRLRRLLKEKKE